MLKLFILISLLFVIGCRETVTTGVKSMHVSFTEIQTILPLLKEKNADLYLKIEESDLKSADLVHLLKDVQNKEIKTVLWPLLPLDEGPWANEHNVVLYSKLIKKVTDWLEVEKLHPEWITINMENSYAQMEVIKEYLKNEKYIELIELLLGNLNSKLFAKSVESYKQLVDNLHDKGYKVMITTYPYLIDDFKDKDSDIQDLVNVPIAGIDWDAYTWTTYTTAYSGDLGIKFNSFMVYSYGRAAISSFGNKARLALGIIGKSEHGQGFKSPIDLSQDVAAAKAADIPEIDFFNLSGMIKGGGPARWLEASNAGPKIPIPDPKVLAARTFILGLDKLLDYEKDHDINEIKQILEEFMKVLKQ